ncbi:actin-like ATPase domain-containing protein [Aspergillus venezuelensis]
MALDRPSRQSPLPSGPLFGGFGTAVPLPNRLLFGSSSQTGSSITTDFGSLALVSQRKIIVGVDYGTTFTGASYVSSKGDDLSDVVLINTWPGPSRDSETVLKSPSRIAYAADNPRVTKNRWGYQVEPGMSACSWTKLLLDQNTPLTQYDDSSLETAAQSGILRVPEGKSAVDVAADYLSNVYDHIIKTLEKNITEEALQVTPLEFWFTVPAIWSDQAQNSTKAAAERAGFAGGKLGRTNDKVFLVTEPEAAAITALKKYTSGKLGGSIKAGDGVLVCDCGGGTVDITTYLIESVSPWLRFDELCTGIGGKCGSTAIDRNFYNLMSDRFGDSFHELPSKRKGPGSEFMKKFELIKRDFGCSDEETTFELPLNMNIDGPDARYFDDEERLVLVSSEDLRNIFDPVVKKITELVQQQIKDANTETGKDSINRIVLVGGFADSEYLRKSFNTTFGSDGKMAITVPDNPQAAIVQGAALRGLEGLRSTTKRSRRHYGFSWGIPFREGIDRESDSYLTAFTGEKYVKGVMKWMIAKGDKYAQGYADSVALTVESNMKRTRKHFVNLYACDKSTRPERYDAEDVYRVGRIIVDFSNVDLTRFESKTIDGERTYRLSYRLKVIFGAQEGLLKFEAESQGQVIGKASIDFNLVKYY